MQENEDEAAADGRASPHVLEIRVHGVSNTPPHAMLGLNADEVVRAAGDDAGSFWVPKPEVLAQLRASPDVRDDDFRLPPPGVRREAYSWGALARLSTVPFLSSASGLLLGLVRAFWVLIIPFGLVNAAYWARRLDAGAPKEPGDTSEEPGDTSEPALDRSLSGGLVRLFGWALTMLWTSTALTVSVGTVAARCYVRPEGTDIVYVCAALPGQMEALARWSPGARTTAFAAVALVAVIGVGLVGLTGAVRYDRRVSASHGRDLAAHGGVPPGKARSWPFLTRTRLWSHAANGWAGWAYHVASGISLVGLAVTVQLLTWGDTSTWPVLVPTIGFGLVMVVAAVRIITLRVEAPHAGTAWSRGWAGWAWIVLAVAGALLAGVLVPLPGNQTINAQTEPWTLALTTWAVPVLIGLLAVLVVGALALRTAWSAWWPALVVGVGVVAVVAIMTGKAWLWWGVLALLAVYAVLTLLAAAPRRADGSLPDRRWRKLEGWGGAGPAVFLSLAAGFALVLSGTVVTGTVAWLNTAASPERSPDCSLTAAERCDADTDPLRDPVPIAPVAGPRPDQTDQPGTGSSADRTLPLPRGYDGFSFTSLAAVLALLLSVLAPALLHLVLRKRPLPVGRPGDATDDPWRGSTQGTRRLAALAHRAETLVAILAVALWLAIVVGLAIAPFDAPADQAVGPAGQLAQLGLTIDAGWHSAARAVGVAAFGLLVASVVLGGSGKSASRPWGLLWDLTCFLPRVAHPFAAPSYAERAVPELRGRIDDWLGLTEQGAMPPGDVDAADADADDDGVAPDTARPASPDRGGRRVVVAAHSLGAVVAVATLLARQLTDGTVRDPERIALLTFGTQLRAYFGRFFPELFGPEVLGTDPCRRARLWSADPWASQPEPRPETQSRPRSVVGFLSAPTLEPWPDGPRWRSLWRRTDYLGFPVDKYAPSPNAATRDIDHRSSEVDPTTYMFTVATHGGDFRTPQYRRELLELLRRLNPPSAGTRRGLAPDADQPPQAEFTR